MRKNDKGRIFKYVIKYLGASLLGNWLTGKGILRAGSRIRKWNGIVSAGPGNNKGKGTVRAGTGKKWYF